MHTQEESIKNYDRRRNVMRRLFKAVRVGTSSLSESEWDKTAVDFVRVNFAELEARVLAHVVDNGGVIPAGLSIIGRAETVHELQEISTKIRTDRIRKPNTKGRPKHG